MFAGRTVFAQLIDHVPPHEFHKCVVRYRGNYKWRGFSSLDQFLSLAFAQLTFRESLRDIEACLRSVEGKLYHMGFRGKVRDLRWPTPTRRTTGASTPTSLKC